MTGPSGRRVTHLDSAGAGLLLPAVRQAVDRHLAAEEELGGYEAARLGRDHLGSTYKAIASLLNCRPGDLAITESGTKAWANAFLAMPLAAGDRLLTSRREYVSNYLTMVARARRCGASVELMPESDDGDIDLDALRATMDERVRLVSVAHCGAQAGNIAPVEELGAIAREAGALFFIDACQTVGLLPLDVMASGCDVLVGTGRKFLRGPRGTAFAYLRTDSANRLTPIATDLRSTTWTAPDGFEFGPGAVRLDSLEGSIASRIALGPAVGHALSVGVANIRDRSLGLAAQLRIGLAGLDDVSVLSAGSSPGAIVAFVVNGETPSETQERLREAGILVSVIPATMAMLDLGARGLSAIVRASPHHCNEEADVDRLLDQLGRRP